MSSVGALRLLLAAVTLALASGCATVAPTGAGAASAPQAAAPIDPWENWNRKVFAFNEAVDSAVLKPVAEGYRKVVPQLVRTGIDNFFGNIYDVWSAANHLLQGKVQTGLEMGMRVLTNTVFGLGGILDPATEMRLTKRSEDFGQTLGRWGVANGPFMVLPLLGPSTVRDTAGVLVDRTVAPSQIPEDTGARYAVAALEVVNIRAKLLDAGNLADQVSLDKYSFIRDAYLSRRRDAVHDGAPPMETFEDFEDPMAEPAAGAASAPARPASAAASAASAPAAAKPASGAPSAPAR